MPKRPMTRPEKNKIATIRRRRDYLRNLLDTGESTLSWDSAEHSALSWAIRLITSHFSPGEAPEPEPELRPLVEALVAEQSCRDPWMDGGDRVCGHPDHSGYMWEEGKRFCNGAPRMLDHLANLLDPPKETLDGGYLGGLTSFTG